MNRRNFLSWFGLSALATYFPFVLAACSTKTPESATKSNSKTNSSANLSRTDGFKFVGSISELDRNGGQLLDKNFAAGSLLVVRNPSDPQSLSAVNPTCTHRSCTVGWQPGEKSFFCSCHGSKFSSDGEVINGPASKPLATYEVKIENDSILIKNSDMG